MPKAIGQTWTESERGWGTRPDGYSVHLSEEDRLKYNEAHGQWLVETYGNEAPDEYDRPDSESPFEVQITEALHKELLELKEQGKYGVRHFGNGKPEGWVDFPNKGGWRRMS
jgi:hypothetical protein